MRYGALFYDKSSGRYDIRFGFDDYRGGLHCGECFEVLAHGKWIPTRIEMWDRKWYLVGFPDVPLHGLQVRMR